MSDDFEMIITRTQETKQRYSKRNDMQNEMEKRFLMNWDEEAAVKAAGGKHVKITKDPGARNKVIGASRLLTATDPVFSIPLDSNRERNRDIADKIEKAANIIFQRAGRIRRRPIHYDAVLSALLFGEMHIAITSTADMLKNTGAGTPAAVKRSIEKMAAKTPYMFDVWDPRTGYPEFGNYGLSSYYREVETTIGPIIDEFGSRVAFLEGKSRTETATLCQYWDYDKRYAWIDGMAQPFIDEIHGLPFIPVVAQIAEGSDLFSEIEDQRQPFLYTLWKSGLVERMNLILTVLYTNIFAFASNPTYYERVNVAGKHLNVDFSVPGGRVTLNPGEDFGPVIKNAMDPALLEGMNLAENKVTESTIYSQTLGEPLGENAPFSMVSLLHQAGRLPLLVPQRTAAMALADAMQIALEWWRLEGGQLLGYDIDPSQIPDDFELECKLDVALPQDKLQAANAANMLTEGENPKVSNRWVREELLNIGDSSAMDEEIWGERAGTILFQTFMQEMIRTMQQRQAQADAEAQQAAAQQQGEAPLPEQRPGQGMSMGGGPPEGAELQGLPPVMAGQEGMVAPGMEQGGGMPNAY